jgi:hypothetical protein
MNRVAMALILGSAICASCGDTKEKCESAGGTCLVGSAMCPNRGSQECQGGTTPAGAFCCLPCASGTKPNDAGTACE